MRNRKLSSITISLITIIILAAGTLETSAQESIYSADGLVETVIDAEIKIHEVTDEAGSDKYNVTAPDEMVTTIPHVITPEEMQKWTEVLFMGNEPFEYDKSKTNEELISLIEQTQMWLDNLDPEVEPELYDYRKELYESQLISLEEMLENSSDENYPEAPDWTYKPETEYKDMPVGIELDPSACDQMIKVYTDIDGETAFSECRTYDCEDFILRKYTFWIQDGYQKGKMEETEEEVCDYVEGVLSELGLAERWTVKSCRETYQKKTRKENLLFGQEGYYYDLTLVPVYEGCEVLENQEILFYSPNLDGRAYKYYYENLAIRYSNGHIVFLEYGAPLEITGSKSIDNLIDYNDALNIFKEYMENVSAEEYQDAYGITPLREKIMVMQIDYGIARVRINPDIPEFIMTPVWAFRGSKSGDYGEGMLKSMAEISEEFLEPILMINAVDGSIIDIKEQW